jgi:hypothetical protein
MITPLNITTEDHVDKVKAMANFYLNGQCQSWPSTDRNKEGLIANAKCT